MKLLEINHLTKKFGEFQVVRDLSFTLEEGEITSVIGPNGAGKTSFLKLISGELIPTEGEIILKGEDITKCTLSETAKLGISRCFQVPSVFDCISVIDNLKIAGRANKAKQAGLDERCENLLERVGMLSQKDKRTGELDHGGKRVLELCMGFIQDPVLILSDEIIAGLDETSVELIGTLIKEKVKLCTPLIVEHRLEFVFGLSDRVITLHKGEIIADGSPEEIRNNEMVKKIYYGDSGDQYNE
jgi:branched-chain amino acid transport system ATP-binding protein